MPCRQHITHVSELSSTISQENYSQQLSSRCQRLRPDIFGRGSLNEIDGGHVTVLSRHMVHAGVALAKWSMSCSPSLKLQSAFDLLFTADSFERSYEPHLEATPVSDAAERSEFSRELCSFARPVRIMCPIEKLPHGGPDSSSASRSSGSGAVYDPAASRSLLACRSASSFCCRTLSPMRT